MTEYIDFNMGYFLEEEFLNPLNLTQATLAKDIGVPSGRISQILNNKRKITADTDLRLTKYFGLSEGYFLRVQDRIDLMQSKMKLENDLKNIIPYKEKYKESALKI